MKKKLKPIMLPTDKCGHIILNKNTNKLVRNLHPDYKATNGDDSVQPQHLYLVSDERIKERDWYIWGDNKQLCQAEANVLILLNTHNKKGQVFKVIATTDKSLSTECKRCNGKGKYLEQYTRPSLQTIRSGYTYCGKCKETGKIQLLPQIPNSFIKYFVEKNGDIDEVEVEYTSQDVLDDDIFMDTSLYPKLTDNNEVIIHLPKDKLYTKQDMDNAYDKGFKDGQDTER